MEEDTDDNGVDALDTISECDDDDEVQPYFSMKAAFNIGEKRVECEEGCKCGIGFNAVDDESDSDDGYNGDFRAYQKVEPRKERKARPFKSVVEPPTISADGNMRISACQITPLITPTANNLGALTSASSDWSWSSSPAPPLSWEFKPYQPSPSESQASSSSTSAVTDRINREIDEMRRRLMNATITEEEFPNADEPLIETPPGLSTTPMSVYDAICGGELEAEVYKSPEQHLESPQPTEVVAQYFHMNSPTSADRAPSQREIGTQTELTLSIRADRVTQMPKVEEVTRN